VFERRGADCGEPLLGGGFLLIEGLPGGQPGAVRQEMAQVDLVLVLARELGDELHDAVLRADRAGLDQQQDRRGRRHHFRQRRQVEEGIGAHRLGAWDHLRVPEGPVEDDALPVGDQGNGAWHLARSNRLLEKHREALQAFLIKPRLFRRLLPHCHPLSLPGCLACRMTRREPSRGASTTTAWDQFATARGFPSAG